MKADRYFYSIVALVSLVLALIGFWQYYTKGLGDGGRVILPEMRTIVLVHGMTMTAWIVIYLLQAGLIAARQRKLHMKLGWSALILGLVGGVTGCMVAVMSVRSASDFMFHGMLYSQFLLVMLVESLVFAGFVLTGVGNRKKPAVHRAMMLWATLSIMGGSTVRIPALAVVYGGEGWIGIFGPTFTLGAVILLVRRWLDQKWDRPLWMGFLVMVVIYVSATELATTGVWEQMKVWFIGAGY